MNRSAELRPGTGDDTRHRGKHPIYISIPATKLFNKLIHPQESMSIQGRSIAMILSNRGFHSTQAQDTTRIGAGCEMDVA